MTKYPRRSRPAHCLCLESVPCPAPRTPVPLRCRSGHGSAALAAEAVVAAAEAGFSRHPSNGVVRCLMFRLLREAYSLQMSWCHPRRPPGPVQNRTLVRRYRSPRCSAPLYKTRHLRRNRRRRRRSYSAELFQTRPRSACSPRGTASWRNLVGNSSVWQRLPMGLRRLRCCTQASPWNGQAGTRSHPRRSTHPQRKNSTRRLDDSLMHSTSRMRPRRPAGKPNSCTDRSDGGSHRDEMRRWHRPDMRRCHRPGMRRWHRPARATPPARAEPPGVITPGQPGGPKVGNFD
jgi:hypothetical protein